ncbi:hypothetical protein U9M48_003095 [Paspalum notatum var. saurae]|uniref:Uncharacterized protein n=1 Tax=Paspalum notatum var. saurae TaxID=547442 RepID=A0AAQ3PM88_PASNO
MWPTPDVRRPLSAPWAKLRLPCACGPRASRHRTATRARGSKPRRRTSFAPNPAHSSPSFLVPPRISSPELEDLDEGLLPDLASPEPLSPLAHVCLSPPSALLCRRPSPSDHCRLQAPGMVRRAVLFLLD